MKILYLCTSYLAHECWQTKVVMANVVAAKPVSNEIEKRWEEPFITFIFTLQLKNHWKLLTTLQHEKAMLCTEKNATILSPDYKATNTKAHSIKNIFSLSCITNYISHLSKTKNWLSLCLNWIATSQVVLIQ